MIIRRNVYFSAIDEQTGEERLYSTTELVSEESYLEAMFSETEEEREFAEKKEKKMRLGDKLHIGSHKHLSYGKYRKAQIDSLEDDKDTARKGRRNLAKEDAKLGALGAGIGSAIGGGLAGGVKGAAVGAAIGTVAGGAGGYVGSRVKSKIARGVRNVSSSVDAQSRRTKDQIKVADGQMTKAEFTKKYGKEK